MRFTNFFFPAVLLLMSAHVATLYGQGGVSSASVGMSRAGLPASASSIRVEEFANYHRHNLPLPAGDRMVELTLNWMQTGDGETVLQAGITTPRITKVKQMPPLNLAIVIDRSGSMSGDRIAHVKQALLAFVGKLRDTDRVSLVCFNHEAQVFLEPQRCDDRESIFTVIETIQATGSTNMHAGLMLGYKQVKKHYNKTHTNRVILLTDGIANTGVVDPEAIVADSVAQNKKGVDLSTIGLGSNLNYKLLDQLAKSGRGLIHFVGDSKDIRKTFVKELDSLLAPAARNVELEIRYAGKLKYEGMYGYEPRLGKNKVTLTLDNLNCGATQVVLARFANPKGKKATVEVRLAYEDAVTREPVELHRSATPGKGAEDCGAELPRTFAIARLATGIKEMAALVEAGKYEKAVKRIDDAIKTARKSEAAVEDKNVARVYDIATSYRKKLSESLADFKKRKAEQAERQSKLKPLAAPRIR